MAVQAQTQPRGPGRTSPPSWGQSKALGWDRHKGTHRRYWPPSPQHPALALPQLSSRLTPDPQQEEQDEARVMGKPPCFPWGNRRARPDPLTAPSIIQEPEQDKAEVTRAPCSRESMGAPAITMPIWCSVSTPPGTLLRHVLQERVIILHQTAAPPAWSPRRNHKEQLYHSLTASHPGEHGKGFFFWQAAFKRGWAWGTQGGNPQCLGLRSGQDSLTSLSKPQRGVPPGSR